MVNGPRRVAQRRRWQLEARSRPALERLARQQRQSRVYRSQYPGSVLPDDTYPLYLASRFIPTHLRQLVFDRLMAKYVPAPIATAPVAT